MRHNFIQTTGHARRAQQGFTIVELLIVIVVIGILATISLVAYTGIQATAAAAVLKSDLKNASTQLEIAKVESGSYPDDDGSDLPRSDGTTLEYTAAGGDFCLTASSERANTAFRLDSTTGTITEGPCTGHEGTGGGDAELMVTTLAGSTAGSADGTGLAAQFYAPRGVAVDTAGNVYVADYSNHRIRKITPGGVVTTLAGSTQGYADGTGAAAQFRYPFGVAVDTAGNVYVADYGNNRIRKITPSGVVTTLAGSTYGYADGTGAAAQFRYPFGVAVDAADNIYVADQQNHRIRKITPAGIVTTVAGNDSAGFTDGTTESAQFDSPTGVAVDASGAIYIADYFNHRIRMITPGGVVTTLAGSTQGFADGTGSAAQFDYAYGVTVDAVGNVFVADTNNRRIRKITSSGVVTTLAGSTEGFADGTGSSAQFNFPSSVAVDTAGNVYVADTANHRIRKIE